MLSTEKSMEGTPSISMGILDLLPIAESAKKETTSLLSW